jgi:hypothetical protein
MIMGLWNLERLPRERPSLPQHKFFGTPAPGSRASLRPKRKVVRQACTELIDMGNDEEREYVSTRFVFVDEEEKEDWWGDDDDRIDGERLLV